MKRKVEGAHRDARSLNPALNEHVASALSKGLSHDPAGRPRTASEFCSWLEGANPIPASGKAPVAVAATVDSRTEPLTTGRTWADVVSGVPTRMLIAAALVLALLAGFAHFQAEPGSDVKLFGFELWHKGGTAPPR